MTTRTNWLDESMEIPALDERVQNLEHFTNAMADGVIDEAELQTQNDKVVKAMKAVQDELSDEQHEKVTVLLVELMALSTMSALHELASLRQQRT